MKIYSLLKSRSQQGAALVVAMLILSLVTVLAISMTVEHDFAIRRISNQMAMQQGYSYLRGVESIAQKILRVDLRADKDDDLSVDHLGEIWAMEASPFILDNGDAYIGKLSDLQGRFNLNSLSRSAGNTENSSAQPAVPFTVEQGIFIRLLQAFNDDDMKIDYQTAVEITESVVDYLDADQNSLGFNCGEDDAYSSIERRQAHRTPNSAIASVSELRLICNLPVALYERIKGVLTVWPLSGKMVINLNTAPPEILRSVFIPTTEVVNLTDVENKPGFTVPAPLALDEMSDVLDKTGMQPEKSEAGSGASEEGALLDMLGIEGYQDFDTINNDVVDGILWPNAPVGLHSDYFILESLASISDLTVTMSSVISRKNGTIKLLARSTGGL